MTHAKRDSGIEVLRIIAILMVICVHAMLYGGYNKQAVAVDGIVASSALVLQLFLRACVNVFVIISGYFMINSSAGFKKSYTRLLKLYTQILFYSVVLTAAALFAGVVPQNMVKTAVLRGIFPLSGQLWYFLTDYFLLMLFVPFINIALKNITKKQFRVLLIITTAVLCLWVSLAKIPPFSFWVTDYGYEGIAAGKNVFSFAYIYIIGAYIGKFFTKNEKPRLRYLLGAIGSVALSYIIIKLTNSSELLNASKLYSYPLIIAVAVFLLLFFKDLHFHSRIINLLASTTLGVYAIHEFKYIRTDLVWDIFDFSKVDNSNLAVNMLRLAACILIIFAVCAMIELLRQQLFRFIGFVYNSLTAKNH